MFAETCTMMKTCNEPFSKGSNCRGVVSRGTIEKLECIHNSDSKPRLEHTERVLLRAQAVLKGEESFPKLAMLISTASTTEMHLY